MKKKILQIIVLFVPLMFMLGYGLMYHSYGLEYHLYGVKFFYGNHTLYGERKIIQFPFEMVKDLPEEPNWYEENVFDELIYYFDQEREIGHWLDELCFKGIDLVNKSGDPIPFHSFELGSMFGVLLFQNDGNLVLISSSCGYEGLKRMEVFENSIQKYGKRYCYTLETIIDEWDGSYIDSKNNNTLYYYINDGEPKIQKMDEGVKKVDGHYLYECTSYPILLKNGQLYSYILEGAEWYMPGDYGYYVEEPKIKKIILTDLQGTCEIKKYTEASARLSSVSILPNEREFFTIWLEGDGLKEVEEGEYDLTEGCSILQKEDVSVVTKELSNTQEHWILLDRSSGYDDRYFW